VVVVAVAVAVVIAVAVCTNLSCRTPAFVQTMSRNIVSGCSINPISS
jgi:hypothetical protein